MTDETYRVRRIKLAEPDANRIRKWASLWADLIHVDMVLAARSEVPDVATNAFHRRAVGVCDCQLRTDGGQREATQDRP